MQLAQENITEKTKDYQNKWKQTVSRVPPYRFINFNFRMSQVAQILTERRRKDRREQ
jgi:hypothetical protein